MSSVPGCRSSHCLTKRALSRRVCDPCEVVSEVPARALASMCKRVVMGGCDAFQSEWYSVIASLRATICCDKRHLLALMDEISSSMHGNETSFAERTSRIRSGRAAAELQERG